MWALTSCDVGAYQLECGHQPVVMWALTSWNVGTNLALAPTSCDVGAYQQTRASASGQRGQDNEAHVITP